MSSEFIDHSFGDISDGQYLLELFDIAPSTKVLLAKVREGALFRGLLTGAKYGADTGITLSEKEVQQILDPNTVNWEDFHTSLLESIFAHRGTNKTNAAQRSKDHTDEKFSLIHAMCRKYPDTVKSFDTALTSVIKKQTWRSGVDALAIDFTRLLEDSIFKGGGELVEDVQKILEQEDAWEPMDREHAKTIYYIAGASLRMAKNQSEAKNESNRHLFALLHEYASITKEMARGLALPLERVKEVEAVELIYPSAEFYKVTVKIESVFHNLLNDNSVNLFGPGVVGDICTVLSKLVADFGFDRFVPGQTKDDVSVVFHRLLEYYGHMRGKEYARKMNGLAGASNTETTRATLGTIAYLNQLKKKKRIKEEKAAKEKSKKEESTSEGAKKNDDKKTSKETTKDKKKSGRSDAATKSKKNDDKKGNNNTTKDKKKLGKSKAATKSKKQTEQQQPKKKRAASKKSTDSKPKKSEQVEVDNGNKKRKSSASSDTANDNSNGNGKLQKKQKKAAKVNTQKSKAKQPTKQHVEEDNDDIMDDEELMALVQADLRNDNSNK